MEPLRHRHVFRYLEVQDRFVRVRVLDGAERAELCAALGRETSGATWRSAIVARCIEGAPAAATEALYALAIGVNPELDLRALRIDAPASAKELRAPPRPAGGEPRERLRSLGRDAASRLAQRVVGQEQAREAVARAVRRAALGWERRGPLGSFLFVGPTGTGKTELARALAEALGSDERLVRVDCSEFAEGHEYAKLLGAPPGYVGHADGGVLGRALAARQGTTVVLFDEVEKAHPRLHHLLLQVLDEGHLTDGRGQRLDLRDAFVVLTSNTGTSELVAGAERLGFPRAGLEPAARRELLERALARAFRPEFLARLDEILVFEPLSAAQAQEIARREIARRELGRLATRVRRGGARVEITGGVARWVAQRGFSPARGAREIEQVVRREVEAPLAEALLASDDPRGWWHVAIRGGKPCVRRRAAPSARARRQA